MARQATLSSVEHVGWLAEQPASLRQTLIACAELRDLEPGQTIYAQDDEPGGIYGLDSGSLAVSAALGFGLPRLVHIARPGWWVGEAAMVSRTPRRVEVTARSPSRVLCVAAASIAGLARKDSDVWRCLGQLTVLHMDSALLLAGCLLLENARERVIGTLLRLTVPSVTTDQPIEIQVSQTELAELAGLSRNSVGPVLRELERSGLLVCRRRSILLCDPQALGSLLDV